VKIWVKVCGLTTELAVHTAVAVGVDAVGFVFAPSTRQVTAAQALALSKDVPTHIARVAVMLHPTQSFVDEVMNIFKPDVLQTDWQDFANLQLPGELSLLPVLRAGAVWPDVLPGRCLFEGPVSGVGETADWSRAAQVAQQGELILAGGLNPANVAAAIRVVRPFGVDVSSGVESAPGVKDPAKIIEFVRAARAIELDQLTGMGRASG
jgi:phosphoribosylanthranilate isomerase